MNRRRLSHWLIAVLACLAMIGLHTVSGEAPDADVRTVDVGRAGRLYNSTVTVNGWTIGQVLYTGDVFVGRSSVLYLAVNVTVTTEGPRNSASWQVGGTANGRRFATEGPIVVPQPGFRITQDVVFELSPDDLAGFTVTFLDRAPIYAYDPQLNVNLGVTRQRTDQAVAACRYATGTAATGKPEVIR